MRILCCLFLGILHNKQRLFVIFPIECVIRALGMENNDIPDSAVTASSSYSDSLHEPWRGRLNNVPDGDGGWGCWLAGTWTLGEWLQIDLGKEKLLTKLATQGRPSFDQWVLSYKILFSSDGISWKEYKENGDVKVIVVQV